MIVGMRLPQRVLAHSSYTPVIKTIAIIVYYCPMNPFHPSKGIVLFFFLLTLHLLSAAQDDNEYIHTKDGKSLETRHKLILSCVRNYGAPAGSAVVKQLCECEVNLLDRRYTMKEIKDYQKKYKDNGFARLMEQDTLL